MLFSLRMGIYVVASVSIVRLLFVYCIVQELSSSEIVEFEE